MSQSCPWCGTEFESQTTGRSVKRFCSTDCRQNFHVACRIWGEEAYGTGEVSAFQLRTCFARRARRTERDLAPERGTAPETGTRTSESLTGLAAVAGVIA